MSRESSHRISHLLGTNIGYIVSKRSKEGLWVGFKCSTCGKISDEHLVKSIGGVDTQDMDETDWN